MEKYVRDSYTEHVQILSQSSLNGYKRLFGGRLMEWIDVVAGVVARRHSNRNVTTAAVDNLRFEGPAYGNETIVLCGYITYTGRTSMEVCVRTYVEELNGHKRLINVAYLVMVALDENERPVEVPRLVLATEEGGAPSGAGHRGGAPGMGSRRGAHPPAERAPAAGEGSGNLLTKKGAAAMSNSSFFMRAKLGRTPAAALWPRPRRSHGTALGGGCRARRTGRRQCRSSLPSRRRRRRPPYPCGR